MRSKWRKYILSSAIVLGGVYTGGVLQDVFAQQPEQPQAVYRGEAEDLTWQLKRMEESFAKQQEQMKQLVELATRQQEQIQVLKNRIDTMVPQTTTTQTEEIKTPPAGKEDIKQIVKDDLATNNREAAAPVTKEEVKKVVEDYLATDEARKKMGLGMPAMTTIYTPDEDKFSIGFESADNTYSLGIGFRMQFRASYKDRNEDIGENDTLNMDVRRARLCFGGNIYSKMTHYYVELDGDSFDLGVRDFYVYWTPLPELNAKLGYFKVPFNQQRMSTSAKLLFQDRAIASEEFDQDRDYGFDIYGKPFDGHLEYHAAMFQGAGEDDEDRGTEDNLDNELMYVFNVRYNPFGKYDTIDESDLKFTEKFKASVAASVVVNPKERDEKLEDTDGLQGVLELSMKYRGFSWHNEYFMRSADPEHGGDSVDSNGFFSQAGYFVIPKRLEVAARYSYLDRNKDVSDDIGREYSGGINYYFRPGVHRSKLQADVGHYENSDERGREQSGSENQVRLQYQIVF
ncbi:MAG: porin [Candidatus Brocadia sp. WS118]|nr:MAG: porin [Candidatus Brocadia sp. WS118]